MLITLMWLTLNISLTSTGFMSRIGGFLFALPILEVSRRLSLKDQTNGSKFHVVYSNTFAPLRLLYHFHNTCFTPLLIFQLYHFLPWILQQFPGISE